MIALLPVSGWRAQTPPRCSPEQRFWLTRPGALTTGLRLLGSFELAVIAEHVETSKAEDHTLMGSEPMWCREVLMLINGTPCVLARSVTPLQSSWGVWQGLRRLGGRPLADLLYHDPGIIRSVFEVSRIGRAHGLFASLCRSRVEISGDPVLFARRSVFRRATQPLLVSECFLPAFWALARP